MPLQSAPFRVPEPFELIEFFGVPPFKEDPANGLWCYEIAEPGAGKLLFCFNVIERWLKTQVVVQDKIIDEVVHEGAARLWIEHHVLVGECHFDGGKSRLEIKLREHLTVNWSILTNPVI